MDRSDWLRSLYGILSEQGRRHSAAAGSYQVATRLAPDVADPSDAYSHAADSNSDDCASLGIRFLPGAHKSHTDSSTDL